LNILIKDTIIIENETGLHARPATEISKEAMKYKSDIKFVVNGKTLNAKSPLMIMAAGIKSKSEMEIICDGEDEKEALKGLMTVIKSQIDK
jgi:phosphocarrier,  HPr family